MLKISFTNAEVSDHGYGLEVNGKSLEDIISTALGTKLKGNGGYGSGLPSFNSNSCDVTVIINPHREDGGGVRICNYHTGQKEKIARDAVTRSR